MQRTDDVDAARIWTPRWSIGAAARAAAICLLAAGLSAQTAVKPPKNKYTPQQDVELGREAAAEVRKQYPVVDNERIARYLGTVGDRLLEAAPPELDEPVFEYSFTPVNLKEINAFALPGGPMFINRGLVDAAASEAELAGVMAHELAHVLLRHGTANASKAQNPWLQLGQIAGAIGGAVVGGAKGEAIAQGSQFGLGTLLLKYSREYEKQADLLGVQIMARAGYDPRALGQMFETIERASKSSGGSGPQWMSSHPNPGNRTQYINQEADALTVAMTPDTSGFEAIKPVFASLPPPKPMRGAARADAAEDAAAPTGTPGQPLPPPAEQYREISGGKVFRASVPVNWTALPSNSAIKVVPENGYGQLNGQTVFACGVEFGVVRAASRDLAQATDAWLDAVAQSNPDLQRAGARQATRISGRSALATPLVNPSPTGGRERIAVYTTFLADGSTLFYYLTLVPEQDAGVFQGAFRRIGESIRLTEVR
jgi:Zn-dependent protease with chaperone function